MQKTANYCNKQCNKWKQFSINLRGVKIDFCFVNCEQSLQSIRLSVSREPSYFKQFKNQNKMKPFTFPFSFQTYWNVRNWTWINNRYAKSTAPLRSVCNNSHYNKQNSHLPPNFHRSLLLQRLCSNRCWKCVFFSTDYFFVFDLMRFDSSKMKTLTAKKVVMLWFGCTATFVVVHMTK